MTPIWVSLTCKRWREVILDCRPAWSLKLLHLIPDDHIATWIGRSGDHRGIQLTIPRDATDQWLSAIMPHRNRIERLLVLGHHDVMRWDFPNATTVVTHEDRDVLGTSFVTPELYPSLKSLYVYSGGKFDSLETTISASLPVTELHLQCHKLRMWHRLLPSCASTIVTLHISVRVHGEPRLPPVVFPNLVVLVIGSDYLPLELITPRMTFLGFRGYRKPCQPHLLSSVDVSRVTTLFIDKGVPAHYPSYPSFPSLRRMFVQNRTRNIHPFLQFLLTTPTIHANLKQVVFQGMEFSPDEVEVAHTRGIALEYTLDSLSMQAKWKKTHIADQ